MQDRLDDARQDRVEEAQEIIDAGLDGDLEQLLAAARGKLDQARTLVEEVVGSFRTSARMSDLPEFESPEPDVPIGDALPSGRGTTLVSSARDFAEQCRALRDSKAYGGGEDEDGDG